ncbi:MAG: hemolysin family protein [Treponema sp.]|nr:hemolysin family protein [Treponema sp.]
MDLDIVYTIIVLLVLLLMGTFFSATEMAFASLNRARIKHMAETGDRRARLVLKLYERFDELISTLLICNNAVALTTATVSAFLFVRLIGEAGPFVSTVVITIIVVVFTDDLPKSIAKQTPEKVALFSSPVLRLLMLIFKPINFLLVKWKAKISNRFISKKDESGGEERGFRGEELLYVVEEAEQDGTITEEDSLRISNAIEFNDLLAEDILTPRVNIVGIPKGSSIEDMANIFLESGYSRLPVYEETIDNIVGVVHIRDFLKCTVDETKSLDDIMALAVYTTLGTPVPELFKLLQKKTGLMAIVADEYGGTEGLVTMEDILEQLVGDIWDENDEIIEEFLSMGNNRHKIICTADIYKMYEYFDLEGESESSTVGGWIIDMLKKIPQKGDSFTYKNLTVTVTKADQKRAVECIVEVAVDDLDGEKETE